MGLFYEKYLFDFQIVRNYFYFYFGITKSNTTFVQDKTIRNMIQIECTLFNKVYNVKKICRYIAEMPRNAKHVFTAYTSDIDKTVYWIYSADSGVLYAKKSPTN